MRLSKQKKKRIERETYRGRVRVRFGGEFIISMIGDRVEKNSGDIRYQMGCFTSQ